MNIVLVNPEIAGNTGNIIRLCANVGASLHLIEPIGFSLEDKLLKRAGLDYHDLTNMTMHPSLSSCLERLQPTVSWALTGRGTVRYTDAPIHMDHTLIYGCESVGLSADDLWQFPADHHVRIPMQPNNRSLNLSNSVALVAYDVWRRHGFTGAL